MSGIGVGRDVDDAQEREPPRNAPRLISSSPRRVSASRARVNTVVRSSIVPPRWSSSGAISRNDPYIRPLVLR
jgi:hypothetical protein